MRITKKQLKQLLSEAITGGVGIGFVGWSNNKQPDFAKSYGKDARYARDILKDKLRVIVREEVEVNSYKEEKVDQGVVDGASLAASHPSEIQTSPNFGGGANLVHSIDYSKAAGVESNTKGQEVLKITEGQLRRIIRETMSGSAAIMNRASVHDQWLAWGDEHGLDPEYDNDGQLMYYTDSRVAADDARELYADVERDNMGQFVIYTRAER